VTKKTLPHEGRIKLTSHLNVSLLYLICQSESEGKHESFGEDAFTAFQTLYFNAYTVIYQIHMQLTVKWI
jgi:hypothetical protein